MQQIKPLTGPCLKQEEAFAAYEEKSIWQTLRSVSKRQWMREWETHKQRLSV